MVNSTSSVTNANTDLLTSASSTETSGSASTGFADTLATCMFFGTTGSSQNGSSSGNPVQTGQVATPATPAAVTTPASITTSAVTTPAVTTPAAITPAVTTPAVTTPAASPAETIVTSPATVSVQPSSTDSSGSEYIWQTPPTAAQLATMTPDQAYWAEQPPAVQALQYMPAGQRYTAAQDLANQGYTIDVPIMVWGWDPLATMVTRQNDGLTWVPSALQPNIPVAPGDSFPGMQSYDPNDPPPGSIQVTTAFAIGTNGQDQWITPAQLAASEAMST